MSRAALDYQFSRQTTAISAVLQQIVRTTVALGIVVSGSRITLTVSRLWLATVHTFKGGHNSAARFCYALAPWKI